MKTAFEQYFTGLRGKRIAVLGLGVSNRPLVRLLLEAGCDVTGCDRTPREKLDDEVLALEALGCKLRTGENYLDGVEADLLFRTPGMHPGHPAIQALARKGAQVTSEMEVFMAVCPCPKIAVTGSDELNLLCCTIAKKVRLNIAAIARVRGTAAPTNAQRFEINTPCKKTGSCANCKSPDTICCQFLVTRYSKIAKRIKVILVNEELGF